MQLQMHLHTTIQKTHRFDCSRRSSRQGAEFHFITKTFRFNSSSVAERCELPLTRLHTHARLAQGADQNLTPVNLFLLIAQKKPADFQADILAGLVKGLAGWRRAPKPAASNQSSRDGFGDG